MSAAPGWFPDPGGAPRTFRWWDGRNWSRWLNRDRRTAPPVDVATPPGPTPGPPSGPPGPSGSSPTEDVAVARPPSGAAHAVDTAAVRVPIAVAAVIGVVVAALILVGLTVVLTEDRIRSGPEVAPPAAPEQSGPVFDAATRTLGVESVSMVLPAAPYACPAGPAPLPPAFGSAMSCSAPVHLDYAGSDDWFATMGFGVLTPELVDKEPEATANNVFGALRRQFFPGTATQIRKLGTVTNPAVPADKGTFLAGEVHYAVRGLPSSYDRMVVGVFPLADGRQAAFFSARPEDAPASVLDPLNRSIATLSAR